MFPELHIDLVAPPFAGHLFPCLCLARGLNDREIGRVRVLTTRSGIQAVERSGLEVVEILGDDDRLVQAIANTQTRVGSNPKRLWEQLQSNLSLMGRLQRELGDLWRNDAPKLVIADFTVPIAGITAQSHGIAWWTGMPTPCALETRKGVPSYLGGFSPWPGPMGDLRNLIGRVGIRLFKRTVGALLSSRLRNLGIPRIYRGDGTEAIYSPEKILGYGVREFEFNDDWPECFEFIGPLVEPPMADVREPSSDIRFNESRQTILVTLGTHLGWAKRDALDKVHQLASLRPDWDFHFSAGYTPVEQIVDRQDGPGGREGKGIQRNVYVFPSIPYTSEIMQKYSAAIVHGGTGIMYACMRSGVPMLVWPHDYDQFDHAARIVHAGVGVMTRTKPELMCGQIDQLLTDTKIRERCRYFVEVVNSYHPIDSVMNALRDRFVSITRGESDLR